LQFIIPITLPSNALLNQVLFNYFGIWILNGAIMRVVFTFFTAINKDLNPQLLKLNFEAQNIQNNISSSSGSGFILLNDFGFINQFWQKVTNFLKDILFNQQTELNKNTIYQKGYFVVIPRLNFFQKSVHFNFNFFKIFIKLINLN
jgi:hypothetical protein